jgi:hypothetical protein
MVESLTTGLRDEDVVTSETSTCRTTVTLTRAKEGCFHLDVLRNGQAVKHLAAEYVTEAEGRQAFAERSRVAQREDLLTALLAEMRSAVTR